MSDVPMSVLDEIEAALYRRFAYTDHVSYSDGLRRNIFDANAIIHRIRRAREAAAGATDKPLCPAPLPPGYTLPAGYRWTGDVRKPKAGDWFIHCDEARQATGDHSLSWPIIVPLSPPPQTTSANAGTEATDPAMEAAKQIIKLTFHTIDKYIKIIRAAYAKHAPSQPPAAWRKIESACDGTNSWSYNEVGEGEPLYLHPAPSQAEGDKQRDEQVRELIEAAKLLADKVDKTSDCDHTRRSCEEIGCIGAEVKRVRAALRRSAARESKP